MWEAYLDSVGDIWGVEISRLSFRAPQRVIEIHGIRHAGLCKGWLPAMPFDAGVVVVGDGSLAGGASFQQGEWFAG